MPGLRLRNSEGKDGTVDGFGMIGTPSGDLRRVNGKRSAARELISAFGIAVAAATPFLVFPSAARASFLPPEMMDSMAMGIAWFVIIFVPLGAIVLFWMVHVLPEKIAHRRHHPQRDAIRMLCLLSLLFGGLLWPIAWLWAYVKPVTYQMAYGTDKHEDYFREMGEKAQAGQLLEHELTHLRDELDVMAVKGTLPARLKQLRRELDAVPAASVPSPAAADAKAGSV